MLIVSLLVEMSSLRSSNDDCCDKRIADASRFHQCSRYLYLHDYSQNERIVINNIILDWLNTKPRIMDKRPLQVLLRLLIHVGAYSLSDNVIEWLWSVDAFVCWDYIEKAKVKVPIRVQEYTRKSSNHLIKSKLCTSNCVYTPVDELTTYAFEDLIESLHSTRSNQRIIFSYFENNPRKISYENILNLIKYNFDCIDLLEMVLSLCVIKYTASMKNAMIVFLNPIVQYLPTDTIEYLKLSVKPNQSALSNYYFQKSLIALVEMVYDIKITQSEYISVFNEEDYMKCALESLQELDAVNSGNNRLDCH